VSFVIKSSDLAPVAKTGLANNGFVIPAANAGAGQTELAGAIVQPVVAAANASAEPGRGLGSDDHRVRPGDPGGVSGCFRASGAAVTLPPVLTSSLVVPIGVMFPMMWGGSDV
jgi:hypothetical protein